MINANELRVGNKALYSHDWSIPEAAFDVTVDASDIMLCEKQPETNKFRPIELQDEHFMKAGFGFTEIDIPGHKDSYFHHSKFMQLSFHRPHAPGLPWLVEAGPDMQPVTSLKSLHQLQNFYFSITGEEMRTE